MATYASLLAAAEPFAVLQPTGWTFNSTPRTGPILAGLSEASWVVGGSGNYIRKPSLVQWDPSGPFAVSVEMVIQVTSMAARNILASTERTTTGLGHAALIVEPNGDLKLDHSDKTSSPYSTQTIVPGAIAVGNTYLVSASISRATRSVATVNGERVEVTGLPNYSTAGFSNWELGRTRNYSYSTVYSAGFVVGAMALFARDISLAEHNERLGALVEQVSIGGNVTTLSGDPAERVLIRNRETFAHVVDAEPDGNGDWTADVVPGVYDITYFSDGCQPICHGPYTVEPEE